LRRRAAAGPPDLDQYTWKSDSSQLLGSGNLRWGSNLFPSGILFLLFGHLVGLLTPHFIHEPFLAASAKQMIAMIYDGLAGLLGFVAVSIPLLRDLARRQPPAGDHRISCPPRSTTARVCAKYSGTTGIFSWAI